MMCDLEPRRYALTFTDANETNVTSITIADGDTAYSKRIPMSTRRWGQSLLINYTSSVTVPLVCQVYDNIGEAWMDVEGSVFTLTTLPVAGSAAGYLIRVSGLPVVEAFRFKITATGAAVTINGAQINFG